jgi:SAM-dependent methyltransferase
LNLLTDWLSALEPAQKVLDLGSGAGSFDYSSLRCCVIGVDSDLSQIGRFATSASVCASGCRLPFAARSFDLVICHNSLEHFADVQSAIDEIARVLKENGRLFISVPDGYSLSDRLYRFLYAGGGHFQRFTFERIVHLIETGISLHLVAWKWLYSSFIYIDRANFQPAPRGPLPGPFPRRMRLLGHLPVWFFSAARLLLNVATRLLDRLGFLKLSIYGWALAFDCGVTGRPTHELSLVNVCTRCGFAANRYELRPVGKVVYRCNRCQAYNPLFRPISDPPFPF